MTIFQPFGGGSVNFGDFSPAIQEYLQDLSAISDQLRSGRLDIQTYISEIQRIQSEVASRIGLNIQQPFFNPGFVPTAMDIEQFYRENFGFDISNLPNANFFWGNIDDYLPDDFQRFYEDAIQTTYRLFELSMSGTDTLANIRTELEGLYVRNGISTDILQPVFELLDRLAILDSRGNLNTQQDYIAALNEAILAQGVIPNFGSSFPGGFAIWSSDGSPDVSEIVISLNGRIQAIISGEGINRIVDGVSITDLLDDDDRIIGTAFDDILDGSFGADELIGAAGNDHYFIDDVGDLVRELIDGGMDRADVTRNIPDFRAPDFVELVVLRDGVIEGTPAATGTALVGVGDHNVFLSGPGTDTYDGNDGIDTLSYENARSGVSASLLKPTAFNTGGAGTDKIDDIENLIGSPFDDVLVGAQGVSNVIDGGDGNDLIVGFAGPDILIGGAGSDLFSYNRLSFRDSLSGGGEDTIVDFESGQDTIDLSRLGIDQAAITLVAGRLEADVTGNGSADFAINFDGGIVPRLEDVIV